MRPDSPAPGGNPETADTTVTTLHPDGNTEYRAVTSGRWKPPFLGVTAGKYIYLQKLEEAAPETDITQYSHCSIDEIKEHISNCESRHQTDYEGSGKAGSRSKYSGSEHTDSRHSESGTRIRNTQIRNAQIWSTHLEHSDSEHLDSEHADSEHSGSKHSSSRHSVRNNQIRNNQIRNNQIQNNQIRTIRLGTQDRAL